MNILLINHYAGSPQHGMEYRPYYLAREWVRAGHRVHICAASYSHVRAQQPDVRGQPTDELIDGIAYRWWPTPKYLGKGWARLRNMASFLWQLWRDAASLAHELQPDVVLASSTYPMDIWVARRIARLARAKLVYEVHDLWPLSLIELSRLPTWHPFVVLCQKAENDAYRDADHVISMLPKVASHMQTHGLDLRKLHVVPNGVSPEEWSTEPAPLNPEMTRYFSAQRALGRSVVGYTGSHGVPNALDVLLDAAAQMRHLPISFVLVGDGMEKQRLAQRVAYEKLDSVTFFPPIPKSQIPRCLQQFDVAYIGWQRSPVYRFGIAPNKLMDYMMAGCVILHSVEAGNDPVADAGCGLTVMPESPAAVVQGITTLLALSHSERLAMGHRGRAFVCENYTYPVLAQRFLQALTA